MAVTIFTIILYWSESREVASRARCCLPSHCSLFTRRANVMAETSGGSATPLPVPSSALHQTGPVKRDETGWQSEASSNHHRHQDQAREEKYKQLKRIQQHRQQQQQQQQQQQRRQQQQQIVAQQMARPWIHAVNERVDPDPRQLVVQRQSQHVVRQQTGRGETAEVATGRTATTDGDRPRSREFPPGDWIATRDVAAIRSDAGAVRVRRRGGGLRVQRARRIKSFTVCGGVTRRVATGR